MPVSRIVLSWVNRLHDKAVALLYTLFHFIRLSYERLTGEIAAHAELHMIYIHGSDLIIIRNIMHMRGIFQLLNGIVMRTEIYKVIIIRCKFKADTVPVRKRYVTHVRSVCVLLRAHIPVFKICYR